MWEEGDRRQFKDPTDFAPFLLFYAAVAGSGSLSEENFRSPIHAQKAPFIYHIRNLYFGIQGMARKVSLQIGFAVTGKVAAIAHTKSSAPFAKPPPGTQRYDAS